LSRMQVDLLQRVAEARGLMRLEAPELDDVVPMEVK
jgi:hypothetical protein